MAEYFRESYCISTDPAKLDLEVIHGYLKRSYWSPDIPFEIVKRALAHSLCFGLYHGGQQIGFARAITDQTTFAYLADVFILEEFQGKGLGKWLIECIMAHPELQGLRRWMLATRDAHGLYAQYGFAALKHPEIVMEISRPDIYRTGNN